MVASRVVLLGWSALIGGWAQAQQAPYSGNAWAVPGTMEFEHYDTGGAGIAFNDLTPTNTGSPAATLRSDAVDLATDGTASGGVTVQDAAVGEWLEYTAAPSLNPLRSFVNLTLRHRANYEKQVRVLQDGVLLASPLLPATSGTTWGAVTLEKVPMSNTSASVLRVEVVDSGGHPLFADKTTVGLAEQWDVIDAGSTNGTTDSVNLRNVLSGELLRLTSKDHLIYAGGTDPAATNARFILAKPAGAAAGVISLRSRNASPNDTFVSISNTTSAAGAKGTSDSGNDQRFTWTDLGATPGGIAGLAPIGRRISITSVKTSRFLSVANDAGLRLDSLTIAQWINRLPVIDPIFDRTMTWPTNSLTLSGAAQEIDPSGSIAGRNWTQVSGPTAATLGTPTTTPNSPSAGKETTSVAVSGLARGIYVFRFTVTDDTGDAATRDVEVAVMDEANFTTVASTDARIQYFGRVQDAGGSLPRFGWSGTGIRIRFNGPTLSLRLEAEGWPGTKQMFYSILDGDDSNPKVINLTGGTGTITHIATGLPAGDHTLTLYALSGPWIAATRFKGVLLGAGTTLLDPPARPTRRMEFYGDSITEGGLMPDYPYSNTYQAYAAQTTRKMGAESHIMAKSGLGLVKTGYAGSSAGLGSLIGQWNRGVSLDSATIPWAFSTYLPQVVVINILQNDKWQAGSSPDSEFITAYVLFLRALRAERPNAHVVCALGSMDATDPAPTNARWMGIVTAAVNQLRTEDRDGKLHTVFFPWLGPGTGHPNTVQAGAMADQLKAYLDGLPVDVWTDGVAAPAGYQSWLTTKGFPLRHATEAQPMADADGDGAVNLLEYALGGNPWSGADGAATRPALVPAAVGGGAMTFRFPRAAADVTYQVEWSPTMEGNSWQKATWPLVDAGGGMAEVTVPGPAEARLFMRLMVGM